MIQTGSLIKFKDAGWVGVELLVDNGDGFFASGEGKIRLAEPVKEGDLVLAVIPPIRLSFDSIEKEEIRTKILNSRTFGIYYDWQGDRWISIDPPIDGNFNFDYQNTYLKNDPKRNWMISLENTTTDQLVWIIRTRGLRYTFESETNVRFFFVNKFRTFSQKTGLPARDLIKIFKFNSTPEVFYAQEWESNKSYGVGDYVKVEELKSYFKCVAFHTSSSTFDSSKWDPINPSLLDDINLALTNQWTYEDGYIEPRRVIVSFGDRDEDRFIDNPEAFDAVVFGNHDPNTPLLEHILIFERYTSWDGYFYYRPKLNVKKFEGSSITDAVQKMDKDYLSEITRNEWTDGLVAYCKGPSLTNPSEIEERFYIFDMDNFYDLDPILSEEYYSYTLVKGDPKIPSEQTLAEDQAFITYIGRSNINFSWKHYAPLNHRIDPAPTNIMDAYVLTNDYDFLFRSWLLTNGSLVDKPIPPSEENLRITFREFENYKMLSDQIIWHPVKYKLLFGPKAEEEYRVKFKAIKVQGATLSDGEIKSAIIDSINIYFTVSNWDFGETFYFTEMAAFIHQRLSTQLSSIVIVPINEEARFGNLFEIKCNPDEMFISCAGVDDVEVVTVNTESVLRINS